MPSVYQLVAIVYMPLLIWLVHSASIKHSEWSALPSLSWGAFMIIPLAVSTGWSDQIASMQAAGTLLLGLGLLGGDAIAVRYESEAPGKSTSCPSRSLRWIAVVAALLAIAIIFWHVHLMPSIPLLEKLTSNITPQQLLAQREASSKLLDIPKPLMWLFNQAPTVFGVVAMWSLWRGRKFVISAVLGVVLLTYALITTSLATAFLFVGAICCMALVPCRAKVSFSLSLVAIISLFAAYTSAVFLFTQSHKWLRPDANEGSRLELHKQPFTSADCFRTDRYATFVQTLSPVRAGLNRLIYRAILTPADVAHRWYLFFSENNNGPIGWSPKIKYPDSYGLAKRAPSNVIGIWAYQSRFPDKYIDSTSAYASADADAYARFGFIGIGLVTFALLVWRIIVALVSCKLPFVQLLGLVGVFYVAALLPHASFQAIFISQGVLTLFLLMLLVGWSCRRDDHQV